MPYYYLKKKESVAQNNYQKFNILINVLPSKISVSPNLGPEYGFSFFLV